MTNIMVVAKDFSRTPGPRRRAEGKFSGEEFLDMLKKRYVEAVENKSVLIIDLDGAAGYATSFLEAAFGGLAREFDQEEVQQTLQIKSDEEPDLIDEIGRYITEARRQ